MEYAQLVNLMTSAHQLCRNSSLYGHFTDRKLVSGTQSYTYKSDKIQFTWYQSKASYINPTCATFLHTKINNTCPLFPTKKKRGGGKLPQCITYIHNGVTHTVSYHIHLLFPCAYKIMSHLIIIQYNKTDNYSSLFKSYFLKEEFFSYLLNILISVERRHLSMWKSTLKTIIYIWPIITKED